MSRAAVRRALLALIVPALLPVSARAARPLWLGFSDRVFTSPQAQTWLHRSAQAGADIVRIDIGWVAPDTATRPRGFNARNPSDPHYDFSHADAAVRLAAVQGLRVLLTFTGAPQWAEGPGRPVDASPGSWRPDPGALADYGAALALRYSGHYPDPNHPGTMLPRVAAFQVWNEPNLDLYLSPQWDGGRPVAADIYRDMLNAFYRGAKSADGRAVVVTAGTAPFGDPPGGQRIMPARFWREVFCLRAIGGRLENGNCHDPVHFDVLAHHPYSVGPPTMAALQPDDVSIPDLGKLTRVLRAAEHLGTALPRTDHPLWITEVSYDSRPPDPQGVPADEHAHWLEQTLADLWRQGARVIIWDNVRDQPPIPSYAATNQSGVYYLNGHAKPALGAYRFPLVAWRQGRTAVEVWGRAPAGGRLTLQQHVGRGWVTLRTLGVRARTPFQVSVSLAGAATIRAVAGSAASLAWRVP